MKMKRLLKDFLAIGMAVSFVLSSTIGAAAEGMETTESGRNAVVESALPAEAADVLEETEVPEQETETSDQEMDVPEQETEVLPQETEGLTETETETAASEAF